MIHPYSFREPQKVYRLFLGGGLHGRQLLIAENVMIWRYEHPNIPISAGPLLDLDITGPCTYTYELQYYRLALVCLDAAKDKRIYFFALEGIDPVVAYREYRPARLNHVKLEALNFLDGRFATSRIYSELHEWLKAQKYDQEEHLTALKAAHTALDAARREQILMFADGQAEHLYNEELRWQKHLNELREKNPTPQQEAQ